MDPSTGSRRPRVAPGRPLARRLLASALLPLALLLPAASPVAAADLTLESRPLLGGHVRPGAWTAIDVTVTNSGPSVTGELRISGPQQGQSTYGQPVELPSGAVKRLTLYAQPSFFGTRFTVSLVSGDATLVRQELEVTGHDTYQPIIGVIAERPQGITGDIEDGTDDSRTQPSAVVTLTAADLPPRVEAWSAVDRLVWQDVDSGSLTPDQKGALAAWVAAGGRLIIAGGTTGTTTLGGFPAEMLPFVPTHTVDASIADIEPLVGTIPGGPASTPALAGTLAEGTVLARSGDDVIAAERRYGQGVVTVIGFDPGAAWITGSAGASSLWRQHIPLGGGAVVNPLALPDDGTIVGALGNLPAVELPRIEQLFLLLLAYILLIGPVNYLVLRRLDKREWAWLTMPLLVIVFAVGAYSMGLLLKGTDVVVNELAIVRGAAGADRGVGQAYVGVFSPTRETFEVRVAGGALLTNPMSQQQQGNVQQPLDVLFGETARLRGYQVGFGVLRGFRAEAPVTTPRVDTDLRFTDGTLTGTLSNRSDMTLEAVAIVYGGGIQLIPTLGPGETVQVELTTSGGGPTGLPLSERLFGRTAMPDAAAVRTVYSRRAVIDQLTGYSAKLGGQAATGEGPVVLAWHPAAALPVEIADTEATHVGDTLYVLPTAATISGPTVFANDLIRRSIVETAANEAFADGGSWALSRGTMTVELRTVGFEGDFTVSELELALTQGEPRALGGRGTPTDPLPDAEQPDQDDPVGDVVAPGAGAPEVPGDAPSDGFPEVQLFDRVRGLWLEYPHMELGRSYVITDPARFVDATGAFRVRFVNRSAEMQTYFGLSARLVGSVG